MLKSQIILITAYSGVNISLITKRHLVPNWIKILQYDLFFQILKHDIVHVLFFFNSEFLFDNDHTAMVWLIYWRHGMKHQTIINQYLSNQWISDGCIRNFGSKGYIFTMSHICTFRRGLIVATITSQCRS